MGELLANVQDFAHAAREYCHLIEDTGESAESWLERLTCVLPRIHAAVLTLDRPRVETDVPALLPDYDLRFALFSRLRGLLGDMDAYCMEFDAETAAAPLTGSLADDITDIYFELKRGLDLLDCDPSGSERAACVWRSSFLWHWGQHLVDAERHLYRLEVCRYLLMRGGRVN